MCDQDHFDDDRQEWESRGLVTRRQFGVLLGAGVAMLLPQVVNAVAVNIVYLLSGVIVVEWVFAFPGIGQGLVQATSTSDAFNVEAIALVMGAMFIGVSVAADLLVSYLNPRLKAAAGR